MVLSWGRRSPGPSASQLIMWEVQRVVAQICGDKALLRATRSPPRTPIHPTADPPGIGEQQQTCPGVRVQIMSLEHAH